MKKASIVYVLVIVLFACSKKDDNNDVCATDAAHISGSYKITAVTYKLNAVSPTVDYFNVLFPDACEKDDVITFKSNGTYQKVDAGLTCTPVDSYDGTWSINGNTMNVDGDPAVVEKFDCKVLVTMNSGIMIHGDELRLTLTRQ